MELSSVCIVDVAVVAEAKVESHPDAIVDFLRKLGQIYDASFNKPAQFKQIIPIVAVSRKPGCIEARRIT